MNQTHHGWKELQDVKYDSYLKFIAEQMGPFLNCLSGQNLLLLECKIIRPWKLKYIFGLLLKNIIKVQRESPSERKKELRGIKATTGSLRFSFPDLLGVNV